MIYNYRGQDIFVEVSGEGDALLLLHGWGCDHSVYRRCVEYLATSYRVYNFDLPGFGSSQEPTEVWGTQDYADMIRQFILDQNIISPSFMGHSFGGRVSILYASQHEANRIVLIDSAGIVPKRSLEYYAKVYSYKLFKRICYKILSKERAEALIESRRKGSGSADYNNASPMMRQVMSKVVNEDLKSVMPQIKASTLLFWGDLDTATPLSDAKTMEQLIPDSGLVVAEGCGHFSFAEMPVLFDSVIKSFFQIN
ncbi:MAG: alpha/beta hydrolase [Rikenellaceae bacterium]